MIFIFYPITPIKNGQFQFKIPNLFIYHRTVELHYNAQASGHRLYDQANSIIVTSRSTSFISGFIVHIALILIEHITSQLSLTYSITVLFAERKRLFLKQGEKLC